MLELNCSLVRGKNNVKVKGFASPMTMILQKTSYCFSLIIV